MTALAADRKTIESEGKRVVLPVIASDILYLGAMCFRNAAGDASPVATAGFIFSGVNVGGRVDNSSGSAGDLNVTLATTGTYRFVCSGLTKADHGKPVYASDDQTVTLTPGTPQVGFIDGFTTATEANVKIDGIAGTGGLQAEGELFIISGHFSGAVGAAAVTAIEDMELPYAFKVLRGYAKAQIAPGSGYQCDIVLTDGTTASTVVIDDTATKGEAEAINNSYAADTDFDVTLVDDNASGSTADVNFHFICQRL